MTTTESNQFQVSQKTLHPKFPLSPNNSCSKPKKTGTSCSKSVRRVVKWPLNLREREAVPSEKKATTLEMTTTESNQFQGSQKNFSDKTHLSPNKSCSKLVSREVKQNTVWSSGKPRGKLVNCEINQAVDRVVIWPHLPRKKRRHSR